MDAVVLACLRNLVLAVGHQIFLHLVQVEVLHKRYGPVATIISFACPLVQRGSVIAQVETFLAREVGVGSNIDVAGVVCVVHAALDVEPCSACAGSAEVVSGGEESACAGIAQRVSVAALVQYPHLCQVGLQRLSSLYLVAYLCQVGGGSASAGESHQSAFA